ncbi:hypothetical protein NE865_02112 [Phthorimaea operculella]|nr:hypothetical protein NE865_02112 [Phthorimaea operculella]
MRTLCLALSLSLMTWWAKSSPLGVKTLDFDNLDTGLDSLSYEVEEEDLDDFIKELGNEEASEEEKRRSNNKSKGFKKEEKSNKGSRNKHNKQDLKKSFQIEGIRNRGAYNDDDLYSNADAAAAQAVGVQGTENRIYRKGTKTSGFHRIHHKDEYKKDKTFYEDDETIGKINKIGSKASGLKIGAGLAIRKGHINHDRKQGAYGKRGYLDKGFSEKDFNSFNDEQAFEKSFKK